jgi:uncharacterized protein
MIVFLIIALSVYLLMNTAGFVWLRYVFQPAGTVSLWLTILYWLMAFMFPLARIFTVRGGGWAVPFFQTVGNIWLGVLFYFFWFSLITGVYVLCTRLGWVPQVETGSLRAAGLTVLVVLFAVMTTGFFRAWKPVLMVHDIELKERACPPEGLTLVQLSDIHLETGKSVKWWETIVSRTNSLDPDVIVLTGDLLDEKADKLSDFLPGLKALNARYGVFAVTGNHEFYAGVDQMKKMLQPAGIRLLRNASFTIPGVLHLVGVDDLTAQRMEGDPSPDLKALTSSLAGNLPIVLLNHQPVNLESAQRCGIDLQLSGHTHGGQIWPFNFFTKMAFPYQRGRHDFDGFTLIVSTGTGVWGPPFRIGTHSEIIQVRLKSIGG